MVAVKRYFRIFLKQAVGVVGYTPVSENAVVRVDFDENGIPTKAISRYCRPAATAEWIEHKAPAGVADGVPTGRAPGGLLAKCRVQIVA